MSGLGRDAPTVIITNDRRSSAKQLIERYARRMTIEQRLAESIRSFHLNALAGAAPPTCTDGPDDHPSAGSTSGLRPPIPCT